MKDHAPHTYKVTQLGPPDRNGAQVNIRVEGFDDLVTHHPKANRNATMVDGVIVGVESRRTRSYAVIDGEIQEIETLRTDEYRALGPDQALLIKDFILEDRRSTGEGWRREVDVPSPIAGHVTRRDDVNALVEISDGRNGPIVARIRHLSDIAVKVGDEIEYGQKLGTQDNRGLGLAPGRFIHVHMEMDTSRYREYQNYISDLASGRLPVQAEHRRGVEPTPVVDDGTLRLGESSPRIRDLQRVMEAEGYRAAGGRPLDRDGVYRLGMQGALLDFQRDHGLPQTGDVDAATLQFAPASRPREADRPDHARFGQPLPVTPPPPHAPGHPEHPDHRGGLPAELETPVNRRAGAASFGDPLLEHLAAALRDDDERALSLACAGIERSPEVRALVLDGHAHLEGAPEREPRHEALPQREPPALIHG